MKTIYKPGRYYVKIKGRGLYCADLKSTEVRAIFRFQKYRIFDVLGVCEALTATEYDIDTLSKLEN